ncbi:hypothetical protein [Mucilaginibacter sp.]|uniref:hypothetical protein n=1 Tax=Mucilaginibacter sp. TaxID=1882438 RepID=UPI003B006A0B
MKKFYFLDESGDAEFFGKRGKKLWEYEGWHPILIMGLLETNDRKRLRKDVLEFQENILNDVYYNSIDSMKVENHFFHARSDHTDVRAAFFQFLRSRNDFKCYFSIVEKEPAEFIEVFDKKPTRFYFHVVEQLLDLPIYNYQDEHSFYLSRRNKTTNDDFDRVIKAALNKEMQQENILYSADIVKSSEYPELCVIDYMLWALQRWIMKGEARFIKAMADKITYVSNSKGGLFEKTTVEEFLNKKI